jgi:hypothetical protein
LITDGTQEHIKEIAIPQRKSIKKIMPIIGLILLFSGAAEYSQAEENSFSAILDWTRMEINISVQVDLKKSGISLPTGRPQAEERLFNEYISQTERVLYSIPFDSSSTIRDLVEDGRLKPNTPAELALSAKTSSPAFSADMNRITGSYTINLHTIMSKLKTHDENADFMRTINPPDAPSYTGIIIIANDELPVHGRHSSARLEPCLFPKIWDTDMNLIFDKKFNESQKLPVHYADRDAIFQRSPSGLSAELEYIVGEKPLRIIARELFGVHPTDPVIDTEDARIILSSEENRRLLREGRLVIISASELLKTDFSK